MVVAATRSMGGFSATLGWSRSTSPWTRTSWRTQPDFDAWLGARTSAARSCRRPRVRHGLVHARAWFGRGYDVAAVDPSDADASPPLGAGPTVRPSALDPRRRYRVLARTRRRPGDRVGDDVAQCLRHRRQLARGARGISAAAVNRPADRDVREPATRMHGTWATWTAVDVATGARRDRWRRRLVRPRSTASTMMSPRARTATGSPRRATVAHVVGAAPFPIVRRADRHARRRRVHGRADVRRLGSAARSARPRQSSSSVPYRSPPRG